MEIYAVGGVVRDQLLGKKSQDVDYVVVGSTPKKMIEKGFIQVGKSFPVFLHPITKSEYALARKERKVSAGYDGFDFYFSPDVTLEEDLLRRDLTINAMARRIDDSGAIVGNIIDPYGGQKDLKSKVLRHVSSAFCEDPVRILRIARFAARLPDFKIDPKTLKLGQEMIGNGELSSLVPERIWQETARALLEKQPSRFFKALYMFGALKIIFAELDSLWFVPQDELSHPEIECGKHTMMALDQASLLSDDLSVRWAVLVHDLGKGLTSKSLWPFHPDHEQNGITLVKNLCHRLKVPSECTDLALLVTAEHGHFHRARESDALTLMNLLKRCDAFRRPNRFFKILLACEADSKGRLGYQKSTYNAGKYIKKIFELLMGVNCKMIVAKHLSDPRRISEKIFNARLGVVESIIRGTISF